MVSRSGLPWDFGLPHSPQTRGYPIALGDQPIYKCYGFFLSVTVGSPG
jgi:hypothetical protein